MYALVGVVCVKPGHEEEVAAMTREHGPGLVTGMNGSKAAYWARTVDTDDIFQHSLWLFELEADARAAETVFSSLRDLPDAPAVFVSVEVCELIAQM
jgi:hypothetical protein